MGLILHPEAQREYLNAIAWYEDNYVGRGRRFFQSVEAVLARIHEAPHTFPRWTTRNTLRYVVVPRFPYRVIFREEPAGIVVYAIAHNKQRAGYWRKRSDTR